MDNTTTFVLMIVLIIVSGIFSGSEIALVTLTKAKIKAMIDNNEPNALVIEKLKSNPNRLLITILIGNNLVNISASVLATIWATEVFGAQSLGIVTGVLTFLVLIFGEIFPKTVAQHNAKRFSIIVSRPLLYLERLLLPIIYIIEKIMEFMMKRFQNSTDSTIELNELKATLYFANQSDLIDDNVAYLLENAIDFDFKSVREIMTDRSDIKAIDIEQSVNDLALLMIDYNKSRIPIYQNSLDEIIKVAHLTDVLKAKQKGIEQIKGMDLNSIIFIKPNMNIDTLLYIFQAKKEHIAIVVENNQTIGLVTLENVLEEIVGEIYDETEKNQEYIKVINDTKMIARYNTTLHEIRKHYTDFLPDEQPFESIKDIYETYKNENDKILNIDKYGITPMFSKKKNKITHFTITTI